jgi:hypothetical protein
MIIGTRHWQRAPGPGRQLLWRGLRQLGSQPEMGSPARILRGGSSPRRFIRCGALQGCFEERHGLRQALCVELYGEHEVQRGCRMRGRRLA